MLYLLISFRSSLSFNFRGIHLEQLEINPSPCLNGLIEIESIERRGVAEGYSGLDALFVWGQYMCAC